MIYNSWCKWHPLKAVMLGRSYHPNFYRDIKNSNIRECLQRIATETEEDFQNYKKVLEAYGCKVIRPEVDINDSIMNYMQDGKVQRLPKSPAEPRDNQLVMGNEMVIVTGSQPAFKTALNKYNSTDIWDMSGDIRPFSIDYYNSIAGRDWPPIDRVNARDFSDVDQHIIDEILELGGDDWSLDIDAPCITCVGKHVYVDTTEVPEYQYNLLKSRYPERTFVPISIGGHTDGCFHTLKEGAIISLERYTQYEESFPGWDVCYLPNQSWNLVQEFTDLKKKNNGKWWLPGEEKNDEFTEFVETWLKDWVGYCEESVFDVNVLMLDDKHVCVSNYNEQAFAYFKKHNIAPIIVPFRHRYFWDGGLHCITLDLDRDGDMENYFEK